MREKGKSQSMRLSVAFGLIFGICLLLAPSSALATNTHLFLETFGSAAQPSFTTPEGIAVDQSSGDLLVIDAAAGTVARFHADGTPANFSALGTNVIDGAGAGDKTPQEGLIFGGAGEVQIAIDESGGATDGDIYVTQGEPNVVNIFSASGEYLGQLTSTSAGPFPEVCGVTVDPGGSVYVGAFGGGIARFVPTGNPAVDADNSANFALEGPCTLAAGAGPSVGAIFPSHFNGATQKLDSVSGEEKYTVDSGPNTTETVDPTSGHLYVASTSNVNEYDASGASEATLLSSFPAGGEVTGVAVNGASGDVYVARSGAATIDVYGPAVVLPEATTEAATGIDQDSAILHGTVSAAGGPETSCQFQYLSESTYFANLEANPAGDGFEGALTASCVPPGPFTGSTSEAVSAEVGGLSSGASYRFRVVATNENGAVPGTALSLFVLGAPVISNESASAVTPTAAQISGLIDPVGAPTSFVVQYVSDANFQASEYADATSVPAPPASVPALTTGSGNLNESTTVAKVLTSAGTFTPGQVITGAGIAPETAIVSVNRISATQSELVLSKAAVSSGQAVPLTARGLQPVTQLLSGLSPETTYHYRLVATNAVATVEGADQTFTTFIQAPPALPDGRAYEKVSPSQKSGEVIPPEPVGNLGGSCPETCLPGTNTQGMPMQSAPDGDSVLYLGQPFFASLAAGPNEYLSERAPGGWSAPQSLSSPTTTGYYVGFSDELSRGVLFQGNPVLSPSAPITQIGEGFKNLYLIVPGEPPRPLITAAPPHREGAEGRSNEFKVVYAGANSGIASAPAFTHIAFEANDALTKEVLGIAPPAPEVGESEKNLYEWVGGQLRLINVLPGNAAAASGAVIGSGGLLVNQTFFAAAGVDHAVSADGSRIFWSDASSGQVYVRIDGEKTKKIEDPGLFLTASADGSKVLLNDGCLYSLEEEECEADLAQGQGEKFIGTLGAAEDLSRVYFVDTAALTGGEENANEEHAEEGGFNLYAWHGGVTSFIGTLLEGDREAWEASRSNRTAQVSPDGRYLSFMAQARLTGYNNTCTQFDRNEQKEVTRPCKEVFEYAADPATLSCASCNPSGQAPLGGSNLVLIKQSPNFPPLRQPANLSPQGDGRLFFESRDTLSPRDTNGHIQDVYEWEPNGIGSCRHPGGCVSLISSGHSPNDSMFMDSSANGDDAFFITREQLLPSDKDQQLDLYDARAPHSASEAVGFPESGVAPCSGEACRGSIPLPLAQPSPGSSALSEAANPKPKCKQGYSRKSGKCVKKRHHHKKHHKRSPKHSRGGFK